MSYPTTQQPITMPPLGDKSARVGCPQCGKLVGTRTVPQRGELIASILTDLSLSAAIDEKSLDFESARLDYKINCFQVC